MTAYRKLAVTTLVVVCLVALTPKAQAQLLDQKVRFTFSAPVEVPGRVLPAGTYVFKALEPGHLTRILSADEKTVYGTFFTVPEERLQPVEKATIILDENAPGAPEKVQVWFYPGNSTGSEFMYQESSRHSRLGSAVREVGNGIDATAKAVGHAVKHLVS